MAVCAVILGCTRPPPAASPVSDVYLKVESAHSHGVDSTSGVREVRFSASRSGMVWHPIPLLRLIEWPDRVLGELYFYWPRMRDSTGRDAQPYWVAHGQSGCRRVQSAPGWAACRLDVRPESSWRAVADSFRALGVWDLPAGGASERRGSDISDQDGVLAEVLIGNRYRRFMYYDLDRLHGEDVARIRAAADLVMSLPTR
jgi:hypothetical protein